MTRRETFTGPDAVHLGLGIVAVAAAVYALAFGWSLMSLVLIALVNLYALVMLWECASRADGLEEYWSLPHIQWSFIQSFLLISIVVLGFANLYLLSGRIAHEVATSGGPTEYLADKPNAIYFAFMTLATQGFGDYVPTDGWTRFLVSWELLTTILLVFLILPLVMEKVGSYTVEASAKAGTPSNLHAIVKKAVDEALANVPVVRQAPAPAPAAPGGAAAEKPVTAKPPQPADPKPQH